jgi:hypothetical protein
MNSTGRFTDELRRLIARSYDICQNCGSTLPREVAAYAGYAKDGSPLYVGVKATVRWRRYTGVMTRYYFHARGPRRYVADYEGFDLLDFQASYDIAVQTIRDIANDPVALQVHADWTMEVTDETGQTALTIPFSKAANQSSGGAVFRVSLPFAEVGPR